MRPSLLCIGALLALSCSPHVLAGDAVRAEFAAAFEEADPQTRDSEALRDYPLYPWLQAERLRKQLDDANAALDSLVADFLAKHGSAPHTQALRGAWWTSLFEREEWAAFLAAVGRRPEQPLRLCQWLTARQQSGRMDGFAEDALAAWRNGRSMPGECDAAFDWLRDEGLLTADRIEQRLRLTLDANQFALARHLTQQLPEPLQRVWTNGRLARQEQRPFLERLAASPEAPIFFVDLEAGLHRHARNDPQTARTTLSRLLRARDLDEAQKHALTLAVAMPSAWSRHREALALFQRVPLDAHDNLQLEWRVRAALWSQDWDEVTRTIAAMPSGLAQDARWRYWAARAAVARGERTAEAAFAALAEDRSYHGFLAAVRLGRAPRLEATATRRDTAAVRQLAQLSAVQRAREWYLLEEDRRAVDELVWGLSDLDADGLEQAALLLSDWGWHQQSIAWLARSGRWDDLILRFPLPFTDAFERAAEATGISRTWLHTIVRTESLYDPRAVSGVGARGIAQIMPDTARGIARRNSLAYGGADQLFDVPTNLLFGAHYLRELDAHFGGEWLFVVPAYNAGRGRIPGWLPDAPLDADIWMENIPFNETRGYIQRALYHYVIVHWRLTGEPGDIRPFVERRVPSTINADG